MQARRPVNAVRFAMTDARRIAARSRLIFALDVPTASEATVWIDRLGDSVSFYKLGMELLTSGDYFRVLELLAELANLDPAPESVPINTLVPIEGTPMAQAEKVDGIDFVRAIATARIMMPRALVRLSAGRTAMSDELQALCFLAGANSIFYGDKLLTTANPDENHDRQLFDKLGINTVSSQNPEKICTRAACG